MADPTYVRGITGKPFKIEPSQVPAAVEEKATFLAPQEARGEQQAWEDIREIDKEWSGPEKFAAGVFEGGTLGLGPAALVGMGLTDARTVDALGAGGGLSYGLGQAAGLVVPAMLSGGESLAARGALGAEGAAGGVISRAMGATPAGMLTRAGGAAEALAGRMIPEAGVMGKLARPALQLGARGASEGAIVNMAHTASDSIIHDKPLAWGSMVSSGVDGALLGGLLGVAAGGIGAGVSGLKRGITGVAVGTGEKSLGKVASRMGLGEDVVAKAAGEGGLLSTLKPMGDLLRAEGKSFGSSSAEILAVAKKAAKDSEVASKGVIELLDKEAPGWVPRQERAAGRMQGDLDKKYLQTFRNEEAQRAGEAMKEGFSELQAGPVKMPAPEFPEAPPSWDVKEYGIKQPKLKEFTKTFEEKPYGKAPPELKEAGQKKVGKGVEWQSNVPEYQSELAAYRTAKEAHGAEQSRLGREFAAAKEAHGAEQRRIQDEWASAREAHISKQEAAQDRYLTAKKLFDDAAKATPKPGATWEAWAKSRSQLQDMVDAARGTVKEDVYRTALNAMDSEIRMAMEEAGAAIGKEGISESYHGALATNRISKTMEEAISGKIAKEQLAGKGIKLTSPDLGALAYSTISGHPFGGAVIVAGKKIAQHAQERLEPYMAEAAYRSAIGAEAGSAVVKTGQRIDRSINKFLGLTPRAVVGGSVDEHVKSPPIKYNRKAFDEAVTRTEQLTSAEHAAQVERFVEQIRAAGHPELADAAMRDYQTAAAYAKHNLPQTKETKQSHRLLKMPKPMMLNTKENNFMRIDRALKHPLSVLDDMEKGTVSRVAVRALKSTQPALYGEIVSRFHGALMEVKESGKFLPADKVAMAGMVLDSPIDSTLQKGFIDTVQSALAANSKPQPKPDEQAAGGSAPITDSSSFQTPTQSALQA